MQSDEPLLTVKPKKNKLDRRILWGLFTVIQLLLVGVAFTAGILSDQWYFSSRQDYPLLHHAIDILSKHAYFDLPTTKKLEYGMIRGMLQAVNDPFTVFVEPPQAELQTNQLQGKFGGIGVRMEQDSQQKKLFLYPLPDSPALRAGMQEGDELLAVDELQIKPETTLDEIQAAIRGPVDSIVKMTIARSPDPTPVTLEVKRAEVRLPSVTWNLAAGNDQVGVVQINVIAETTPDEVKKAIADLQQRGATAFVLDVRNNGGGLVDAGVKTARLFLKDGVVIEQQYRNEPVVTYKVEEPGVYADLPLAILVNKGTASAAEILAGALQGQQRAKLVGSATYGKDSIQLVFDMDDGSSLHVTAARWWVPGLNFEIKGSGLKPDVLIPEGEEGSMLQKAIETLTQR
jgi:carboxyl-terminal processing protease